jgi:hypothetical protein
MGSTAVLEEHLAKVCFFAFSLAFAGDSPKSRAVDSDGLRAVKRSYKLLAPKPAIRLLAGRLAGWQHRGFYPVPSCFTGG